MRSRRLARPAGIAAALLTSLVALVLDGCATDPPEPVVLGAVFDLSGAQSGLDVPSSRGARLAVDEANRAGGVLGRPVRLELIDGESDPATVGRKTDEALRRVPHMAALFGLSDSDMVLAAGRLFLTSGATSPRLPGEVPDYLFLACFGDNVQAAAAAQWAYEDLGARTAVVLYDGSMTYTQLLHGYFETAFARLGGRVLLVEEYRAANLAVGGLPAADLVYLALGPDDAAAGVGLLREAGIEAPIVGGDGFHLPHAWRRHPDVARVFFTTHAALAPAHAAPRTSAFRTAYEAAYDTEPDAFAALGYDAARLLLRAVTDAGSDDPQAVRRALAAVSDFEGVTGALSYPPGERIPRKEVKVLEVAGGETKLVRQLVPELPPPP